MSSFFGRFLNRNKGVPNQESLRRRLFEAVSSRDVTQLQETEEYLKRNGKLLSDSVCKRYVFTQQMGNIDAFMTATSVGLHWTFIFLHIYSYILYLTARSFGWQNSLGEGSTQPEKG